MRRELPWGGFASAESKTSSGLLAALLLARGLHARKGATQTNKGFFHPH
jgi:hypothetical protein